MKANPVVNNAAWIIGCRIVQSLLQLVVGMLCARYLGPANYGLLNYAAAILAFALPFMRMGLNETLVRELTDDPDRDGEIMGTALGMNLLSGLLCLGAVVIFAAGANPGDRQTVLVCAAAGLSLVFGAAEMIRYWFQYRLMAKQASLVMLAAYTAVSAYRLWLLHAGKSVVWFALANGLDYAIISVLLTVIFCRHGHRFRFSKARAARMLRGSSPYIASSLMVVLFQSTDRIMLTAMVGTAENGLYTAAVTCVTLAQFVYVAIVDSARPVILRGRDSRSGFEVRMAGLYGLILWLAAAQAVVFSLFGKEILLLLYGSSYAGAVPVLKILNWYFLFSCMGLVRNVWILARGQQKYLWIINLSGALLNIALNAAWIPKWGARGAAAASLVTQFFANFVMGYLIPAMRENNRLLMQGIRPSTLAEVLRLLTEKKTLEEEYAGKKTGTAGRN